MDIFHVYGSSNAKPSGAEIYFINAGKGSLVSRRKIDILELIFLGLKTILNVIKFGPFCAIQIYRVSKFIYSPTDGFYVHRTLALPYFLKTKFKNNISVVVHNLEFIYYLEESIAERTLVKKLLYFLQYLYLVRLELNWLRQFNSVYCLSEFDYRFLKRKRVEVKRYLIGVKTKKPKSINFNQSRRVFFGNFENVRNYKSILDNQHLMVGVDVYGKNPHNLKISRYKGEFESIFKLRERYDVLVNPVDSRAGIQTKVYEWIEAGGYAIVKRNVYYQFPTESRNQLEIFK